jgi:undecaprenyl-diphosphatase
MPTMFAATLYELYKGFALIQAKDALILATGFIVAFVTALVVVKVFLGYVARHTFVPFAYYRIGFGVVVLLYFW